MRSPDRYPGIDGSHTEGVIVLHGIEYEPRAQMVIGHELFEALLTPEVGGFRERLCQRGASALLLPENTFMAAWDDRRGDLAAVKVRFPLASWEVVATRAAEILPGVVVSKWIDGKPSWRRSRHEPEAMPEEIGVVLESHRLGYAWRTVRGTKLRSWCVCARPDRNVALSLRLPLGDRA